MSAPALRLVTAPPRKRKTPPSLDARFATWTLDNPGVYHLAVKLAFQMKAAGFRTYGMKTIFEVIRWHHDLANKGELFKLNNSYASRLARLIELDEPALKTFFKTRRLKNS